MRQDRVLFTTLGLTFEANLDGKVLCVLRENGSEVPMLDYDYKRFESAPFCDAVDRALKRALDARQMLARVKDGGR